MSPRYVARLREHSPVQFPGANSYPLHPSGFAPIDGCYTMFNEFHEAEYPAEWGVHDDHEGFYVVSGHGSYWLEGEEYEIGPGVSMLAPAGARHGLKKTGDEALWVFIFHFPVSKEDVG